MTHKVLFDARFITYEYTGLGRYVYNLFCSLLESNLPIKMDVLLYEESAYEGNNLYQAVDALIAQNPEVKVLRTTVRLNTLSHHFGLANLSKGYDYFLYPHFDPPLYLKSKLIFVVHDLMPLALSTYFETYRLIKQSYLKAIVRRALKTAEKVFVLSKHTLADVHKYVSNSDHTAKIEVAYQGLLWGYPEYVAKEYPDEKYLLYVGDRRRHKNLKKVIDVFVELKSMGGCDHELVIVGNTKNHDFELERYIDGRTDIRVIGNVEEIELREIYARCSALIFLSKYEGFGIPIIEAAFYNKKIVASDKTSLGEIAPPTALLLDIESSDTEMANKILRYLNKVTRIDHSEYMQQFDWKRITRKMFTEIFVEHG